MIVSSDYTKHSLITTSDEDVLLMALSCMALSKFRHSLKVNDCLSVDIPYCTDRVGNVQYIRIHFDTLIDKLIQREPKENSVLLKNRQKPHIQ